MYATLLVGLLLVRMAVTALCMHEECHTYGTKIIWVERGRGARLTFLCCSRLSFFANVDTLPITSST